jgi:CelD/BcsL family acetyltransferase involved in cellulose biosynthesis
VIRISAIVPATDHPPTLERCLAAIRAADEPPEELIVVDGEAGPGPSAARNAGAARASGDVLVFVDADVLPHADSFRRIREAFGADPGLTALFGAYDDAPEASGVVSVFRNLLHHHVHSSSPGSATTFWAGLGAIRRDAFTKAGGFDDERYQVASIEDIDLGLRVAASGGRIRLEPSIQATHLKVWSLMGMTRIDYANRGVPWMELLLRRRAEVDLWSASGRPVRAALPATAWTALNLGWRHRLSALAVAVGVGATVLRRPRPGLGAFAALLLLNRRFYALLARKHGPARAAAGVGLHTVHHLTGIAAVPVAGARHLGLAAATRRIWGETGEVTVEDLGDFAAARAAWVELAEHTGNLFTSWEWASTWWRFHGYGRELYLVGGRLGDGRLAAIVPLYLASDRRVRTLRLVGNGAGERLGPICAAGDRQIAAETLRRFLADAPVTWDVLIADDLAGGEHWDRLLEATLIRRGPSPVVRAESWDAYLGGRTRHFRRMLGQAERRLAREHRVRFRLATDGARLDADLETFFSLYRARWGPDANAYARREPFNKEFAHLSHARGWLRLWFLELDGRPAAALLAHRFARRAWLEQAARDPAYARASVGNVLQAHVIRNALDDGVEAVELLRGGDPHKLRFATDAPGIATVGMARGARGRAALAAACALPLLPLELQHRLARLGGQDLGEARPPIRTTAI